MSILIMLEMSGKRARLSWMEATLTIKRQIVQEF